MGYRPGRYKNRGADRESDAQRDGARLPIAQAEAPRTAAAAALTSGAGTLAERMTIARMTESMEVESEVMGR